MKTSILYTADKAPAFEEIRQLDGRVTQIFTDEVFAAQMPDNFETNRLVHSTAEMPLNLSGPSQLAVNAWHQYQSKSQRVLLQADLREGISWNSPGFTAPKPFKRSIRTTLTGFDGNVPTSMYMTGSVAVGIVIVSGPGPLAFTNSERQTIVTEAQEALNFLSGAELRAKLQFQYDVKMVNVNVGPQPLSNEEAAEALWRNPALGAMGFTPSAGGSQEYVNHLRNTHHTDWAYVVFFTKYHVRYNAYTNGERVVIRYDNGQWQPDYINRVFAHETCHVFGAADEYTPCHCDDVYGYLNIPNRNCSVCAGVHFPCLMEDTGYNLCTWTRRQIGWDEQIFQLI